MNKKIHINTIRIQCQNTDLNKHKKHLQSSGSNCFITLSFSTKNQLSYTDKLCLFSLSLSLDYSLIPKSQTSPCFYFTCSGGSEQAVSITASVS